MGELSYKQIQDAQYQIVEYKKAISDLIGYLDESGHRKLRPEFFLSGEVAAYKLLNRWEKEMHKGNDIVNEDVIRALCEIDWLLRWRERDFADSEVVDAYEELSNELWFRLMKDGVDESGCELHREIIWLADLCEAVRGCPDDLNDYLGLTEDSEDYEIFLSTAYNIVHMFVMEIPERLRDEMVNTLFQKTEIHKLHFNLFQ